MSTQPGMDVTGLDYGENQEVNDIQSAAPLAAAPSMPTGFGAPTTRPDEPETAGSPFGEGPGPQPREPITFDDEEPAPLDYDEGLDTLVTMYQKSESPELARMIIERIGLL